MARRPSFPARSGRQFAWSTVVIRSAGTLASGKSTGSAVAVGVNDLQSSTLIRTRGLLSVHFDPTTIADILQFGVGLGVYSDDAFVVGQTAMPGPLSDAGFDWVWHKIVTFGPTFTATEDGTNILHNLWVDVDSKAMRKVKTNQSVAFIVEAVVLSGGGSIDYSVSARQLFKLG